MPTPIRQGNLKKADEAWPRRCWPAPTPGSWRPWARGWTSSAASGRRWKYVDRSEGAFRGVQAPAAAGSGTGSLQHGGRQAGSADRIDGARALRDPLDQRIAVNLGLAYAVAGRMQDAIAEDRRGLAIAPSPVQLVRCFYRQGLGDPAILEEAWKAYISMPGTDVFAAGSTNARQTYRGSRRTAEAWTVSSQWAAYFGDYELALERLKAENVPDRRFAWLLVSGGRSWRLYEASRVQGPGARHGAGGLLARIRLGPALQAGR